MAPHNLEVEQALLGAILVNNDAYERVSGFLEPAHFFDPLHQQIYETTARLIAGSKEATPITLKRSFETAEPAADGVTAVAYLGQLAANATAIINVRDYGRTIKDLATRRQLILIGEDIVNAAYDGAADFPTRQQIEEAQSRLSLIAETGTGRTAAPFVTPLTATLEMANDAYQGGHGLSGISTGFKALDDTLGGLQSGDLIILAGRPSMGKSALAINISCNVARMRARSLQERSDLRVDDDRHGGATVQFFSLGTTQEQIATRILSDRAEIPSDKIRRGLMDESEFKRLVKASKELAGLPLFIHQMSSVTVDQMAARARRIRSNAGTGLIVVDYLQLLTGSSHRASDSRYEELSAVSAGLKALALELDVPVLAVSQLSRALEERDDKRPQLFDLRGSGTIEDEADVVMFVFRKEYYVERSKPAEGTPEFQAWMTKMWQVAGKAEVVIQKHRHGPVGTVGLQFDAAYTRFSDLAQDSAAQR
jgi:replicative DNA helicase